MLRPPTLFRIVSLIFLLWLIIHFLSAPSLSDADPDEDGWTQKLGLDHYAEWEAGVTNRLGNGIDRVTAGLGVIRGGLGWGKQGRQLGSLYELVATSNPTPRPAYYDERTSLDRLRLSSTRVLGHGPAGLGSSSNSDPTEGTDGDSKTFTRARRHILVTGGYGSLGKHVVTDLLLGLSGSTSPSSQSGKGRTSDEFGDNEEYGLDDDEEDILVTILDIEDRSAELDHILQWAAPLSTVVKGTDPRVSAFQSAERSVSYFQRNGKLRVVVGDVRDKPLLASVLAGFGKTTQEESDGTLNKGAKNHAASTIVIPPVTGIIHLASYEPDQCRLNPVDCGAVETLGMQNILDGIAREGQADSEDGGVLVIEAERPWIVIPRRGEGWVQITDAYNANSSTASLAPSELLLKDFTIRHPLHSIFLRLPSTHSIIGDPFAPRFDPIPHIVQSALGDLPITVMTNQFVQADFIALADVSQSIIQAARMLELASEKAYLKQLGFVSEVTVVGPEMKRLTASGPVAELAKTAISLVGSSSALAEVGQGGEEEDQAILKERLATRVTERKTLSKVLGFAPAISVRKALKTYIQGLLALHDEQVGKKINVACSSPPSTGVLEEGVLALSGCNVQLLTVIDGSYFTLGCSAGLEEPHLTPLDVVSAIPFKEGVRGVELSAERGVEGKVDLQIRCPTLKDGKPTGASELVVWADTLDGGEFTLSTAAGERTIAQWFTVDFVKRDARAFSLALPPTEGSLEGEEPKRLLVLRDPKGESKEVVFQSATAATVPVLWRLNPICCSAAGKKELWDFFKEDPVITSQVTFPSDDGRTSLVDSTLALKRCAALRHEHERIERLQRHLKSSTSDTRCDAPRGQASEWEIKDLPVCQIDCSAPLVCFANEECKCTRDRCGDPRRLGRFPKVAYSNRSSFAPGERPVAEPSLVERVRELPWDAVILPGARHAFGTPLADLPRAHVVDVPGAIDTHLLSAACSDLDKSPLPFLGDHFLIEALRNQSVAMEDSDFIMVPYYQGCYYNYLQENTFKKLADTIGYVETRIAGADEITAPRIVVPFTHDFGSCTGWWPRLEDVLGRSPPYPMGQATAWQVNGDYNTNCVKPDRDVVVPAVSKHSKVLAKAFGQLSSVTPSAQRKYLAFFAGGVRGFGAIARTRIGCGRVNQDVKSAKILYQQFAANQRYVGTLDSAKFCLLPRGIPAWTTRMFEAIYAGCIPAFIVDRNIFPFQDIFDYSLFSVTIPESEANRVEEILAAYPEQELLELQAHLLQVREAFLFKEGQEWTRKGPLFFSLVSMAMRLNLQYPTTGTCTRQAAGRR